MKRVVKLLILTLIIFPCFGFLTACEGGLTPQDWEYDLTVESIYELVQAKGYEGTFDEFLAAIKGDKGDTGVPGQNGIDGKDGRGITNIELTASIGGYNTYTITYSDNTTSTFTIVNGKDGADGKDGVDGTDGKDGVDGTDGKDGVDGKDGRGIVSITCLTYAVNIGETDHPEYYTYRILYTDGSYFDYKVYNGKNGSDGKDGTTIESITQENNEFGDASIITITDSNGDKKEFTIYHGVNGKDGTGIDTITKTSTDGIVDTYTITFTNSKEPFTYTVTNGRDGADGIGIQNLAINNDGELEIVLTDNSKPINLGKVTGEDGKDGKDGSTITEITKTNTSGLVDTYTISCSNGENFTFTVTNGKDGVDGQDGRGIESIKQTEIKETDGRTKTEIIFNYTDGTSSTPIYVYSGKDGVDGENGIGITNITTTESQDKTSTIITITYGNNALTETFTIYNGKDGVSGEDGKDGRGISSIAKTSTSGLVDTYTITYTDNTTSTFDITNGKDGYNGVSVTDAEINTNNELVISLSDGKIINVGNVKGDDGNGIERIEKTKTDGLKDTYTITYTNGDTTTFTVVNGADGRGIKEIKKESVGLVDTYTITYTDDSEPYVFTVTNGQNGLSAYEIYKIYNPSYTKSEAEWIIDLTNGNLSTNRLTVTFNSNCDIVVEPQTNIKFGGKATKPTDPVRAGYIFEGWYYQGEKWSFVGYSVTENMTLTAVWRAIPYTVSFDAKGYGSYDDVLLTVEDDLVLPVLDINGYTYEWQVDGETITNGKWNILRDAIIELVVTPIDYTITYVLDGGANGYNNPATYNIETGTIVLEDASKENYFFAGWYETSDFSGEKITQIEMGSSGNKTLYAKFSNIITVSINANGGECEVGTVQFVLGEKFTLPEVTAPGGYVFNQWVYDVKYTDKGFIYSYKVLSGNTWIWSEITEIVATWDAVFQTTNGKIEGLTTVGARQSVIDIPTEIDGVQITTLGQYCLYNNTNIIEIRMPETITNMEFRAIYKLENLTKLYYNATKLNNLTNLDNGNFTNCGTLSGGYELIIGKDVQSIPSYFMYNNENVYQRTNKVIALSFEEGSNCLHIGDYAFAYTNIKQITMPDSLTSCGTSVFAQCVDLEEVNNFIKKAVKINMGIFAGCSSLKSIDIPSSVTIIEKSAFAGCSSLQSIEIPSAVTVIEESVFSGCSSLSEIVIPDTVTTIKAEAFSGCSGIKTLTIGEKVSVIENYAFSGLSSVEVLNYNAINVSDFEERYSVLNDYILNAIFFNLGSAKGTIVNIGENVIKIPAYMFYAPGGTQNIKELNYASNCKIEEIGAGAFIGVNLKSITIPNTIKYLGYRAFCDMVYLEEIIFNAKELTYKSSTNGNGNLNQLFGGVGRNSNGVKVIIGKDVENLNYTIFDGSGYAYADKINIIDFSNNSNITAIPDNFFKNTYYITTLILSKTITSIGASAFYSESKTTHLNTIYYMGNQTEFANIEIDNTNDGNKYFNSAKVYYYANLDANVSNGFDDYWYFENGEIKTWAVERYTITYNLNGGINNENNPQQFTKYESDIVLQNPTKENYIFIGWYLDENFVNKLTVINKDKDYVVYAKWSSGLNTISLNAGGGDLSKTEVDIYNDYNFVLPVPTKDSYAFIGWFDENENQITNSKGQSLQVASFEQSMTLIAYWTDAYVLSFVTNSNIVIESQYYGAGDEIVLPTNPTKYNYSFAGWYVDRNLTEEFTSLIMPSSNLTLYAKWQDYTLTIVMPEKLGVSIYDTIDANLFNAVAIDNDGNNFGVNTQIVKGTLTAGTNVDILFTATGLYNKSTSASIRDIKVYDLPTITGYNAEKNYINASDTFNAELFNVTATDTYGNTPTIDVFIVEEDAEVGSFVIVRIQATDNANNVVYVDVENVAYYGTPIISYDKIENVKVTDSLTAMYFNATAVDSFGVELEVVATISSGKQTSGGTITVTFTATDSKGNVARENLTIKVYGTPTLYINDTKLKLNEEINAESLDISAEDSFYNQITDLQIIQIGGNYDAGEIVKYRVTATDIIGNYISKEVDIKIYGMPTLTIGNNHIKHNTSISASIFNAVVTDSFGSTLTVSATKVSGEMVGGTTISVKFTATDTAGNKLEQIVDDIYVYDINDLTISYDTSASLIIKKSSNGEEFNPVTCDSFGNPTDTVIRVYSGSLVGGKTVSIYVGAKDNAGNIVYGARINNLNVYDMPTITWAREHLYIYENEIFDYFVYAEDNYGVGLPVTIEIIDGSITGGTQATIRVTAVDIAGNIGVKDFVVDVLSLNQAYVTMYDYINKTFKGYQIVDLNTPYTLPSSSYGWTGEDGLRYTDKDGNSLINFTTIGEKKLYLRYYVISSKEDMIRYSNEKTGYFVLTNDIDMQGYNWTPIGSVSSPFGGTFEGNNYKVYNINIGVYDMCSGFFGRASNAKISNLTIENFTINQNATYDLRCIGGLVGSDEGSNISNCKAIGSITINRSYKDVYIGGLVAYARYSKISNCVVDIKIAKTDVEDEKVYVGGLIGLSHGAIVQNCSTSGEINASAKINLYVGGLIGIIYYGTDTPLTDCYSSCTITSEYASSESHDLYIGGLLGYINDTNFTVSNCYTISNINIPIHNDYTRDVYIGGLIGYIKNTKHQITIDNCYSQVNMDLNTNDCVGGLIGYVGGESQSLTTITNCYSQGQITTSAQWIVCGGLISYVRFSTITNCYSFVDITLKNGDSAGGLIYSSYNNTITNCYSATNITITANVELRSGGFVAYDSNSIIANSYSEGNISITSSSKVTVGGFAGSSKGSTFIACYTRGDIYIASGATEVYVGGFVGENDSSTVIDCYISSSQTITKPIIGSVCYDGKSATNSEIWTFVAKTWDPNVWNLYTNAKPTLKTNPSTAVLSTKDDLVALSGRVLTSNYELSADIDLEGMEWIPIKCMVGGVFDGKGYTISNFNITTDRVYNGFFEQILNANIQGLKLEDFTINYETQKEKVYVGGLAGFVSNVNIERCCACGDIEIGTIQTIYVGGLAGYFNSDKASLIKNCYTVNTMQITYGSSGSGYAGGLIGYLYMNSCSVTITACYHDGNITVKSYNTAFAGGLVGRNVGESINTTSILYITECYVFGDISAKGAATASYEYAGDMIAGKTNLSSDMRWCYYRGELSVSSLGHTNKMATSGSKEEIWEYVRYLWSSSVWNLYTDKNPTLR